MQTLLDLTSYILISVVGGVAGAFLGLVIQYEVRCLKVRKNVLKAIKDLNIEDELAKCPVGLNAKLFNAIKTYLREHNMRDPFVGQGSVCAMIMLIAELREKGKVKPLQPVEKTEEPVKENQFGATKEDSAKTIKLSIGFGDWLERFLEKWGITEECDQLGLTQAYIDKHHLTFKELGAIILDNRHCDYKAEKYRVFANGKTGILTREQLIEANREIEAAAYGLKDSSYIVLHDNICRDVAEPWLFALVGYPLEEEK